MIVVDNTIAYLYIQGQRTAQAEKVLMKDNEWIAPLLWRSEFMSVLALCFRQGTLSLDDALVVAEAAQQFMQDSAASSGASMVSTSKCSSYDCEFVALAENFKVPLITSDKELLKNFPSIAISMEKFVV